MQLHVSLGSARSVPASILEWTTCSARAKPHAIGSDACRCWLQTTGTEHSHRLLPRSVLRATDETRRRLITGTIHRIAESEHTVRQQTLLVLLRAAFLRAPTSLGFRTTARCAREREHEASQARDTGPTSRTSDRHRSAERVFNAHSKALVQTWYCPISYTSQIASPFPCASTSIRTSEFRDGSAVTSVLNVTLASD